MQEEERPVKATVYMLRTAAVVAAASLLVLAGCRTGEESTDVTGRMNSTAPASLQIQVAQTSGHDLTMAAGGVGASQLGTPSPEADDPASAYLAEVDDQESAQTRESAESLVDDLGPGRHVVIVDSADATPVATGRLDSGVATHPALDDGTYTVALLDVNGNGWVSGIGVVEMTVSGGVMTAAVPETLTRTLPVVLEQATAGELMINASPSAQEAAQEISWRLEGSNGQSSEGSDPNRTTVELVADGDYTLEIRAAREGAPEVILQSVRYTFSVTDGQVSS